MTFSQKALFCQIQFMFMPILHNPSKIAKECNSVLSGKIPPPHQVTLATAALNTSSLDPRVYALKGI